MFKKIKNELKKEEEEEVELEGKFNTTSHWGPKDKYRVVHETVTNHILNESLSGKKEAGQDRVITVLAGPRHLNKMENVWMKTREGMGDMNTSEQTISIEIRAVIKGQVNNFGAIATI